MTKGKWTGLLAGIGMGLLIADGGTALSGAREGIQMCLYTVIPSLFPFFVLSGMLTGGLMGLRSPLLRPLGRFCRVQPGTEPVLLIGFLGGYPVGAGCVYQLWEQGRLSRDQAKRMLGFCSNAGPSFLFGICAGMFPGLGYAWLLWLVQILSTLFAARVLPAVREGTQIMPEHSSGNMTESFRRALTAIGSVCGWVVLFRVLLAFLSRWVLPEKGTILPVVISGILELTNGCLGLRDVSCLGTRFLLCSAFLSMGGLCVLLQTASVTGSLGVKTYVWGKLLQTEMSVILSVLLEWGIFTPQDTVPYSLWIFLIAGILMAVTVGILKKRRKYSSISRKCGV